MSIQNLFKRDITRSINGVVKADQLDESSVWQELDEYVITQEIEKYLRDLVDSLLASIDGDGDPTGTNGVWISGFFGSGKSHFIKVLSYLLENEVHHSEFGDRTAIEFFKEKLTDALLFADLKRVTNEPTDAILFNIDSKADARHGTDALLRVFLRVLNERQGFSSDHPEIANIERRLQRQGKLDSFHTAFEKHAGVSWLEERDAWEFRRDELVQALVEVLGQSDESVGKMVDGVEDNFNLTVENFAKWTKEFIDSQGPRHRVVFLVDEVGQFIGSNTRLMLNLQTITEQLGTVCGGRAWVIVTSQEDLDAVLGDQANTRQHDFSKIQGRFKTRHSLSSRNVDEVIKKRLLQKNEDQTKPLAKLFNEKRDVLKNQLAFGKIGTTFRPYADANDFCECYPFVPYQFTLVQKVFESIRKAGATGLHLSQGERSVLDAFQTAVKQLIAEAATSGQSLVSFVRFYPSVEGFLDTTVKRTIAQAGQNPNLQAIDAEILRVLFLIRYIDEIPGLVDNLVTLCVDQVDQDRIALRRDIEDSLSRLERETLIARNGDIYTFLTNEERDISREIKSQTIDSGAEARALGQMLFQDLLRDDRKHTYKLTKKEFSFARSCDGHYIGSHSVDGELEIEIVTPLSEDFEALQVDESCIMRTAQKKAVLVRLPDDAVLGSEIRTYLQVESYVSGRNTTGLSDTTKDIIRKQREENRERQKRITAQLKLLVPEAAYFCMGKRLNGLSGDLRQAIGEALEILIKDSFPKMGYIDHLQPEPKKELQRVLRANDLDSLGFDDSNMNKEALADLRDYLSLATSNNRRVVLYELVNQRYAGEPYGWPEDQTLLLLAQLAVSREIDFVRDSTPIPLGAAYEQLISINKQKGIQVKVHEVTDAAVIRDAQNLGHSLYGKRGPGSEEELYQHLYSELEFRNQQLGQYDPLARTGKYPGLKAIAKSQALLHKPLQAKEAGKFLKWFVGNHSDLTDLEDEFQEVSSFYEHQKTAWESLIASHERIAPNQQFLEADSEAFSAFQEMEAILNDEWPFKRIPQASALQSKAEAVNKRLLEDCIHNTQSTISRVAEATEAEIQEANHSGDLKAKAQSEFEVLRNGLYTQTSILHIQSAENRAQQIQEKFILHLEKERNPEKPAAKPRVTVDPQQFLTKAILENEKDVDVYISSLRRAMMEILERGERIQLK